MVKVNVKSKLDGCELDLSLLSLEDIPVKDIAGLPKATHLDLSSNQITAISPSLCCLLQIVKLDISKNAIKSLPNNFGDLTRLQYLDVSGNQLSTLPVSFYQLKNLKWLDLKDNPLNPHLKQIAGDCLDQKQCLNCAKQVVKFMDGVNDQLLQQEYERIKKQEESVASRKLKEKPRAPKEAKKVSPLVEPPIKVAKSNCIDLKNFSPKTSSQDSLKINGQANKKIKSKSLNCKVEPVGISRLQKAFIVLFLLVSLFLAALYSYAGGEFSKTSVEGALEQMKCDTVHALNRLLTVTVKIALWIQSDGWPILKFLLTELTGLLLDVWEIATMIVDHLYVAIRDYCFSLGNSRV